MTPLERAIQKSKKFLEKYPDAPFGAKDIQYFAGLEITVEDTQENRAFVQRHPELRFHKWNLTDDDFEIRFNDEILK